MHYPIPLARQPALKQLGLEPERFPVTERWAEELLSLPMFPELRQDEIKSVAEALGAAQAAA
jgi:dTDP-4-amino-4,6-dideoxygalactose transaminase